MRSIVSFTARSFPGIAVAEKITVSPSCRSTFGWSPWAIRRSAESGSPCDPGGDDHELVVREVLDLLRARRAGRRGCRCGRACARCSCSCASSGRSARRAGRRVAAASTTCWTRWMFEAKQVTMMRPWQRANTSSRRGPTLDSDSETPGRSAFVESPQSSSSRSRPSSASLRDVRGHAVHRRLVELVVARHQHRAELAW